VTLEVARGQRPGLGKGRPLGAGCPIDSLRNCWYSKRARMCLDVAAARDRALAWRSAPKLARALCHHFAVEGTTSWRRLPDQPPGNLLATGAVSQTQTRKLASACIVLCCSWDRCRKPTFGVAGCESANDVAGREFLWFGWMSCSQLDDRHLTLELLLGAWQMVSCLFSK